MIRVLHSVSNMDRGGIETMLMNYYRHIDRSKVQFDFIVNKKKPGDYDDEIRRLGGHIYQSPGLDPLHYPAYLRFVQQTVAADPRIRILHAHNEAMGLYALKGAEKAGLPVRIAHAHNIWIVRDYKWPLKMLCKRLLPGAATHLWACGRDAGIYYFGKADWERRGQIIPNAIEPEAFRFSPAVRAEMRARYGLEDRVVLGHVGRFDVRKNHERLLEIFAAGAPGGAGAHRHRQAGTGCPRTGTGTGHHRPYPVCRAAKQCGRLVPVDGSLCHALPLRGSAGGGHRGAGRRAGVRIFGRSAGRGAAFAPRHPDPAFCQQCRLGGRLAADAATALRPFCRCRADPAGRLRYQHRRRPLAAAVLAAERRGVSHLREHPLQKESPFSCAHWIRS